jgi:SsrA-binding protein
MGYTKIDIRNKKALYNFEVLDKYVAGIQLTGTEIKSIRNSKASLVDAYCFFVNNELWIKGMHIAEYKSGSYNNHEPKRERKLLLRKNELRKLQKKYNEKGLTIVATRLFINDRNLAKLNIALAKGKHEYDKREDIKKKDTERQMDRYQKHSL